MSTILPPSDANIMTQYRKAVHDLQEDLETQKKKNRERHEQDIDSLSENYKEKLGRQEQKNDETINHIRAGYNESNDRERENASHALNDLKEQLYNAKGELSTKMPVEQHNKEIQRLVDDAAIRDDHNQFQQDQRHGEFTRALNNMADQNNDRIADVTARQAKETALLSSQISDLNHYNTDLTHNKAVEFDRHQREQDAIHKNELRNLQDAYTGIVDNLKRDLSHKDDHYDTLVKQIVNDKDEKVSRIIERQNTDHHQAVQALESGYESRIDQLGKQREQDEKKSMDLLENRTTQINLENQKTLKHNTENFQGALDRLHKNDQDQINSLESSLNHLKTSPDAADISPQAEQNLRKGFQDSYGKSVAALEDRDKISRQETFEKYTDNYRRLKEDHEDVQTRTNQQNAKERSGERLEYMGSIQEMDASTKSKLREQSMNADREKSSMLRQFSNVLDRQRKEYERILQAIKNDSDSKMINSQKQSEINYKNAQRAFTHKQNELIRNYEEKLSNQKAEFDFKLDAQKTTALSEMRDIENRNKQELDAQIKGFEQRMSQMDTQTKEKEQSLSQNYQNEIEKTKRNYELANQKKS